MKEKNPLTFITVFTITLWYGMLIGIVNAITTAWKVASGEKINDGQKDSTTTLR